MTSGRCGHDVSSENDLTPRREDGTSLKVPTSRIYAF